MGKIQIDKERLTMEFRYLVSLDSVSGQERKVADYLIRELKELGCLVTEDDTADKIGGSAGNIYACLRGTISGKPVLFSAHMDTVEPGHQKEAFLQDNGRLIGNGKAVLGADDMAGVAEILEGIRSVKKSGCPFRSVEILFTVEEEAFAKGALEFDLSKIKAEEAFVFDLSGPVGKAAVQAPSILSFYVEIKGKAAHAGFEPEKGVHAVKAAADAISQLPQGRLDPDTTLNIGKIEGGTQINCVPAFCAVSGEIRSFDHEKALRTADLVKNSFQMAADRYGADMDFTLRTHLYAYKTDRNSASVRHFLEASEKLGFSGELVSTFGGSDNNQFAKKGIHGIVLSCGMTDAHSLRESVALQDLQNGAMLAAELMTDRREKGSSFQTKGEEV